MQTIDNKSVIRFSLSSVIIDFDLKEPVATNF